MRMTKKQMGRFAEKIHRLAYELDHDAKRIDTSDHPSYADDARSLARKMGDLARRIEAEIT